MITFKQTQNISFLSRLSCVILFGYLRNQFTTFKHLYKEHFANVHVYL